MTPEQYYVVKPLGPNPQCYMLPFPEIKRRLAAKTLVRRDGTPIYYEEVPAVYQTKDETISSAPVPPDEEPQTYATRDMVAQPSMRRPRGRPRKHPA